MDFAIEMIKQCLECYDCHWYWWPPLFFMQMGFLVLTSVLWAWPAWIVIAIVANYIYDEKQKEKQ